MPTFGAGFCLCGALFCCGTPGFEPKRNLSSKLSGIFFSLLYFIGLNFVTVKCRIRLVLSLRTRCANWQACRISARALYSPIIMIRRYLVFRRSSGVLDKLSYVAIGVHFVYQVNFPTDYP